MEPTSPYSRAAFAPLLDQEVISLKGRGSNIIARRSRAHTEFTKKRRNEFTNDLGKS